MDEKGRAAAHPLVVWRDGLGGRSPALAGGPDVWQVVLLIQELDVRGDAAITAAAKKLGRPKDEICAAVRYYACHIDEVEAQITAWDDLQQA